MRRSSEARADARARSQSAANRGSPLSLIIQKARAISPGFLRFGAGLPYALGVYYMFNAILNSTRGKPCNRPQTSSIASWATGSGTSRDYQKVLAARDDEIDRLKRSIGPGSERWKGLIDRRDRARSEFEAIAGQIGRPVNRLSLAPMAFLTLAAGLALVETPVNKFLFDVALQSSNIASYLVSFAVAVFLLICAHLAGKVVRQVWSEFERKLYVSNIIIACSIMLVLACALMILTIGRAEFSAAALSSGLEGLFSSVGDKVTAKGDCSARWRVR